MPRPKASAIPDTHTLQVIMEEYLEMLREAERGVKKVLSLDPNKEAFWDELSELYPHLTWVESRSSSIQEEIEDLIDELPED
jgi:hypothetical protein